MDSEYPLIVGAPVELKVNKMLSSARPLIDAGAALHWLKPKSQASADEGWSTAPISDLDALIRKHEDGQNIGIRLGEFSKTPSGYIQVIDN